MPHLSALAPTFPDLSLGRVVPLGESINEQLPDHSPLKNQRNRFSQMGILTITTAAVSVHGALMLQSARHQPGSLAPRGATGRCGRLKHPLHGSTNAQRSALVMILKPLTSATPPVRTVESLGPVMVIPNVFDTQLPHRHWLMLSTHALYPLSPEFIFKYRSSQ